MALPSMRRTPTPSLMKPEPVSGDEIIALAATLMIGVFERVRYCPRIRYCGLVLMPPLLNVKLPTEIGVPNVISVWAASVAPVPIMATSFPLFGQATSPLLFAQFAVLISQVPRPSEPVVLCAGSQVRTLATAGFVKVSRFVKVMAPTETITVFVSALTDLTVKLV